MNKPKRIIDTDVHNVIANHSELFPYLSNYWKETIKKCGLITAPAMTPSPLGYLRDDASPPGGGPPASDPQYMIDHYLGKYPIEYAILTGSGILSISLNPDSDYANAVVSAYNNWLVEKWLSYDSRFKGSILVNHSDPAYAAKEIDRMASNSSFVQVLMGSGSRIPFGQRYYYPIYEAAERNGLPVAFHPGSEGAGIAGPATPAGHPSRYLEWHNILPINYMAQLNSIVCEGVFEKFPKLKIVAVEGGIAWLPHLMWRMDKNWKGLRSTVPWLKRLPSEYIKEHVRLTTQPIEEPEKPKHLLEIFEMIEADKTVMFSSDYPHWDFDCPEQAIPKLPEEMAEKIFYENACELYGLTPQGEENGESSTFQDRVSKKESSDVKTVSSV